MFLFMLVQAMVMSFYLTSTHPGLSPEELGVLAQSLAYDGTIVSYATLATGLVCSGMIWTVTSRQLQSYALSYLGVLSFSRREATYWVLWLGAVLLMLDLITIVTGRPLVTEFMQVAYSSANSKILLFVAMVVAAPIFEELLFRGFLFQGLRSSVLGGSGAVVITAAAWAIIHQQYDAFGMFSIFAMGLVLGFARWRTGSVLLTIAMHAMINLVATIQLLLFQ